MNLLKRLSILIPIFLIALALRCYNINFPSIGYHNMKENETLSMAREMLNTDDFITKRVYFYDAFSDKPVMKKNAQPPLVSYQTILSWKLLGENLWGPRLINAVFGASSIFFIYLIGKLLFSNIYLALFMAYMLAVMPLAVFFSRNLQPESPAFFLMLLGNYFYLKFASVFKKRDLFFGGLSFTFAWLYKFTFFIGILPCLLCLPFKELFKEKKRLVKYLAVFFVSILPILAAISWLRSTGQWQFEIAGRIAPLELLSFDYWGKYGQVIWSYIKDENYTIVFTSLALLGMILAFFWKEKALVKRYIIGWALTIIPYFMVFSDFINQHNYYQMPFLVLVCVSGAYAVSRISETIKRFLKLDVLLFLIIILVAVSVRPVYDSLSRMHQTVFLGQDVAGETLMELTGPKDRVFLSSHPQGQAIARYASRYMGWEDDLAAFKEKEKKFNMKYICFYPAEYALMLKKRNSALFEYIQDNYHVKELGLIEEPYQLAYIILERGKGSDPKTFLQSFTGTPRLKAIYKLFGKYIFFYTIQPEDQK